MSLVQLGFARLGLGLVSRLWVETRRVWVKAPCLSGYFGLNIS